jgi:ATP-dependent DNA helicase RecG
LFGRNPNRFLAHAGLDAAAYPGLEKDYAALERSPLRGPIIPLYTLDNNERLEIVENGLVEQAIDFVRRNTTVEASLDGQGRRQERWTDYPLEVIRETVVNAVAHRDYSLSATDIELSLYGNRLEVISPGKLPNGITPARMRTGCRASRNQLIKDVMRDYGYMEHMGMGVPRKIIRGMLDHNGTEPEFIEDGERFIVRLLKEPQTP